MFVGVYESNKNKDRAKDSQSFYHWSLVNIKWLSFKLLKTVIEPLQPLQHFGINFTEKPMITVIVLIKDLNFIDTMIHMFYYFFIIFIILLISSPFLLPVTAASIVVLPSVPHFSWTLPPHPFLVVSTSIINLKLQVLG